MTFDSNLAAIDFIPHQQPMVFVDSIVQAGDDFVVAHLTIQPDLIFCQPSGLPTWTSIELMAQTISLYAGIQGQKRGEKPKIGFLLGTRKLILPIPFFSMGSTVEISAKQNYVHENLGQFSCQIKYQEHNITATLSVYSPENHLDFLDNNLGNK